MDCPARGSRFKQGQQFGPRSMFHVHPIPYLGPQVSGNQSQTQAWDSPRVRKRASSELAKISLLRSLRRNTKEIQQHRNRNEDRETSRHGKKRRKKALDTNGLRTRTYGLKI